jgi:hypothetical protein
MMKISHCCVVCGVVSGVWVGCGVYPVNFIASHHNICYTLCKTERYVVGAPCIYSGVNCHSSVGVSIGRTGIQICATSHIGTPRRVEPIAPREDSVGCGGGCSSVAS